MIGLYLEFGWPICSKVEVGKLPWSRSSMFMVLEVTLFRRQLPLSMFPSFNHKQEDIL